MGEFFGELLQNHGVEKPHCAEIIGAIGDRFAVTIYEDTSYTFRFEGKVDIANFPKGESMKVPELDIRNSKQFSFTNRGVVEQLRGKSRLRELMERTGPGDFQLREVIKHLLEHGTLPPVKRSDVESNVLYHGAGMTYKKEHWNLGRQPIRNIEAMRKNGYYGSLRRVTYITQDFQRAIAHSPRRVGSNVMLLVVSTDELFTKRNIFNDPESLSMTREFMRNFVIPKGIPVSAITGIYHLTCEGESEAL